MQRGLVLDLIGEKTSRSVQKDIGPSEMGGCKRRAWHRLQGTPKTNPDTLGMAAWMGTAIHTALEKAMQKQDPFGERFSLEVEVKAEVDGFPVRGHVDVYDSLLAEVVDWKTTTKRGLKDFPSEQQRIQVQVYGYLLRANGFDVDAVTLVGIPRDGNEQDIVIHTEPYDESVALQGFSWLAEVREADTAPEPEKPARFCMNYCGFYDPSGEVGCPSTRGVRSE